MIKIRLLVLCVLVSTGVFAQNVGKLKNYLKENVLGNVADQGFADKKLTEKGAIEAEQVLLEAWKKEVKRKYHRFWVLKNFSRDGLQMKFDYRVFGERPEDGRSLFISMHGGGNAPEALNTQQWKNQIRLYEPREGVYVAPRAPWDDWNMWFKPGLDEFRRQSWRWRLIPIRYICWGIQPVMMGYGGWLPVWPIVGRRLP